MRLLTMGTPYFSWISRATSTRRPRGAMILAWMRRPRLRLAAGAVVERDAHGDARTSRFSDRIMVTVSRISLAVMKTTCRRTLDTMHELEDVLVLHVDLQADALAR